MLLTQRSRGPDALQLSHVTVSPRKPCEQRAPRGGRLERDPGQALEVGFVDLGPECQHLFQQRVEARVAFARIETGVAVEYRGGKVAALAAQVPQERAHQGVHLRNALGSRKCELP